MGFFLGESRYESKDCWGERMILCCKNLLNLQAMEHIVNKRPNHNKKKTPIK